MNYPIELRLTLIEDGQLDRTSAYRFSREEMMDLIAPIKDGPFAGSDEIEAIRRRRALNKKIRAVGEMLGQSIADFRDDRDGHNGDRRAEIIAKHHARPLLQSNTLEDPK
jgi:hypothetical protein